MKKVTGIILCGGRSSRMGGRPKGLIDFQGATFAERIADMLSIVCDKIIISANSPQYNSLPFPIVSDKYPNQGPLGGIRAGLEYSESDINIFIPCDMPFVDSALILDMVVASAGFDAVVPALGGQITSMPLLLKKGVLGNVETRILEGNRKVFDLISSLKYNKVNWKAAEENPSISKNINTEQDLLDLLNLNV